MLNGLKRRIQLLVGRCVINTVASGQYQIELMDGKPRDKIEIKQHFGYKSIPPKDTKGITLSFGGLVDNTIIISTDNDDAPELEEGESCLYNFFGQTIILKDGKININGDSKQLVTHAELNTALQSFVTALNLTFATKLDTAGSPGTLSLDISSSKTTTINVE